MSTIPFPCVERNPFVHENRVTSPRRSRRNHLSLPPAVYCTDKRIRHAIAASDGCCDWPARQLAAHCGVSISTFYRHTALIVERNTLSRTPRPGKGLRDDTSLWTLPGITVVIPSSCKTPTPPKNEREKLVILNTTTSASTPPTPRGDGVVLTDRDRRRQRNHERRQAHYREVRERQDRRQRCNGLQPLTAVEQAAGHVMACIGVKPTLWKTREAIVKALETWLSGVGKGGVVEAVNAMVGAWLNYDKVACRYPLKFQFKPIGFFGGNHWMSEDGWGVDYHRVEQAMKASVGVYYGTFDEFVQPKLDMVALRAKMAALVAASVDKDVDNVDLGGTGWRG